MGKAQSKRSVDITTEPKKDNVVEEGTGEMKKIEDVDQLKPQVNGDTHHNENELSQKTENVETEHEKDLSTEKEQPKAQEVVSADSGACGDVPAIETVSSSLNPAENGDETLNETKAAETSTTAETPDSSKKPKKEKVKKKWSFRSISFGKKDKQKPSKKEEGNTSTVNGECEKVPEEVTEEQSKSTDIKESASPAVEATTENIAEAVAAVKEEPKTDETKKVEEKIETVAETVTNGSSVDTPKAEPTIAEAMSDLKIEDKTEVAANEINDSASAEIKKPDEETLTAPISNGIEHNEDTPKLNGSTESPKIEVKKEEIPVDDKSNEISNEQNTILSKENEHVNVQTVSNISKDGEIETLKNLPSPPPPLPCSPPPSQVMVFALSESKQEQQPIIEQITEKIEEQSLVDTTIGEKHDSALGLSNFESNNEKEIVTSGASIKNENELTETTDKIEPTVGQEQRSEAILTETLQKEEKSEITEEIEIQNKSSEKIVEENVDSAFNVEDNSLGQEDVISFTKQENKTAAILDNNINTIVETIALIEEYTDSVADASQRLIETITTDSSVKPESEGSSNSNLDQEQKLEDKELSCNSPITNDPEIKISSTTENDLPPLPTSLPSETILEAQPLSEITIKENKIQNEEKSEEIHISDESLQSPLSDTESKSITDNPTEGASAKSIDNTEPIADATVAATNGTGNQKENGVGDNHETPAETVTENVNGVEHKTIEEIKAENQQFEKVATEVTQGATAVAE